MRDGHTRKIDRAELADRSFEAFQGKWQASLTIVAGGPEGTEYPLERAKVTLGRGPDVDLVFDDETMSREHAAFEFAGEAFRVRDLGSMNGILLNESEVKVGELKSGDRVQVGEHVFQFVLEKRERNPRTYVLPED